MRFVRLPLHLAFEAFGKKNGAASLAELPGLISASLKRPVELNYEIGCTILTNPFFFERDQWVEVPEWPKSVMIGKTYDTISPDGLRIWNAVQDSLGASPLEASRVAEQSGRYGEPFLTQARLGQGTFRALVTDAYQRRCAITGESTLPVLEAAHIRPFAEEGPNRPDNGLLLRSDFHKLFDLGLVTVTPDLVVEVSPRIRDEYFNGKAYYQLHGQKMAVMPQRREDWPDRVQLRWHNENRFAG